MRTLVYNSTHKKAGSVVKPVCRQAGQTLCRAMRDLVLVNSFVLRNRQLLVVAKR